MQRRSVVKLALLLTGAAALPRIAAAAEGGWKTIFNGSSLNGWSPIGEANWSLKDGAAEANNGKTGFLVSNEAYGDVQIRAEVWVSPDANSGVFIRCSDPKQVTAANAYEVNLFDTRPDPTYGTGAIVDVAKVSPMPKAGGRWNVLEITAKGDRLSVALNGTKTVDNVQDAKHARGPIALQYGAGTVKFRKVEVRSI